MDAPTHTQFAETRDLRSQGQDDNRDNKAKKWNNGARAGPGRDANDPKHLTPAGPHPIYPRKRDCQAHGRRKSTALGDFDLKDEIDLAHTDEIVPASPRAHGGKIATLSAEYEGSDSDDDDEVNSQAPPVPGAKDAYSGMIEKAFREAEERAEDGEYLEINGDDAIPVDPTERKKHILAQKAAEAAEYVVIKGRDVREEK